ncbi:hypothetical protein PI125_g20443 [Phytophthora idaei]|nr:hypothetical protein PI125_g20443 [Phytophthora idaei]
MEEAVTRQHAHANTVYHCLYAHIKLEYSRRHLAHVFNKLEHTIGNWLKTYNENGQHPLAYLDEAQAAFKQEHCVIISKSSVWRIINVFGLTWKVLERRAIRIKERDIFRCQAMWTGTT